MVPLKGTLGGSFKGDLIVTYRVPLRFHDLLFSGLSVSLGHRAEHRVNF